MCGRYTITQDLAELEKLVRFICKIADFKPRYNIAPRSRVSVLVWENGQNVLKEMRWGLIPPWAKDETIGDKLTNARAETITEKPSYRKPFEKQRCLIPADGFYEWQATATGKQHRTASDGRPGAARYGRCAPSRAAPLRVRVHAQRLPHNFQQGRQLNDTKYGG